MAFVKVVDENYPPAPVLLLSKSIDVICGSANFFHCQNWRDLLPSQLLEVSGLSYRVGDLSETFPDTLSYVIFLESTGAEHSLGSVWKYAFETPSTDLSVVTTPLAMMVLLFLVLLLRAIKGVLLPYFSRHGRRVGRDTHGLDWEKKNEDRIVKFGEYSFRLLFHTVMSVVGIWYFWDKEWLDATRGGTKNLFDNYPLDSIDVGMTWYYLVQCAYNLDALVSLLELSFSVERKYPFSSGGTFSSPVSIGWSKTVRGDFREMAIHHVLTNLLVIGSSHFRLTRIGSLVFLVHDISDVSVDLSKLANFMKWMKCTIVAFTSTVLSWLTLRLGVFPFVIIKSLSRESWTTTKNFDASCYHCYLPFFLCFCQLLAFLHLFWFFTLLKIGWLLLTKGERHDLTEHKNGETTQDAEPHSFAKKQASS